MEVQISFGIGVMLAGFLYGIWNEIHQQRKNQETMRDVHKMEIEVNYEILKQLEELNKKMDEMTKMQEAVLTSLATYYSTLKNYYERQSQS